MVFRERPQLTPIKIILFRTLTLKYYLRLLNIGFRVMYSFNFLKRNNLYKYHYFDKKLIKKGFYILDIGANLGYYTSLFSKWTGSAGKVFAIEPVPVFYDTLRWATRKHSNINLYNYALGNSDREITLATPGRFGYLRTGLTHIVESNEVGTYYEFAFNARMKKASELLKDIPRLDFIKCDIEGYEEIVLPEMKNLLIKFKPIIQLETWGEQKSKTEDFLLSLGYEIYDIDNNRLKAVGKATNSKFGDLLFIHNKNKHLLSH